MGADTLQLVGNGGIFVGQVGVISAAVDDSQGISGSGEVKVHLLNDRGPGGGEVDG